jgi:hypothetical protein
MNFSGDYHLEYGLHEVQARPSLLLASAPNADEFIDLIAHEEWKGATYISPELILMAGCSDEALLPQYVDEKLAEVQALSRRNPTARYFVGTPWYKGRPLTDKPKNAMVKVQNGQLTDQITFKRLGVEEEYKHVSMVPEAVYNPFTMIDSSTGLLICRDIVGAAMGGVITLSVMSKEIRDREILGVSQAQFMRPEVRTLIVSSCWGIGAHPALIGTAGSRSSASELGLGSTDAYYLETQHKAASMLFKKYDHISTVAFCDMIPAENMYLGGLTTSVPLNAEYTRS